MKAISRPATLKEQTLNELRNSIMLGKLAPGQRLVERVLGEQLQVSRTVIRECIRHLESERLVTIIPNSGPIVTELDESQIKEIYQLRALLESEGVYQCALKIEPDDAAKLLQLVDRIESQLQAKQVIKALELTTRLYRKIFSIGDLSITWDLIAQLNSRINQLRIRSLSSSERIKLGPKSLRALVEAISRNDAEEASQASKQHVLQAMRAGLNETIKLKEQ
jgi:DNA-binding GntR family transcriptional regulator